MGFGATNRLPDPFKPVSVEELRAALMQRMLGVLPDMHERVLQVSVMAWISARLRKHVINSIGNKVITVEEGAKLWLDELNERYPPG